MKKLLLSLFFVCGALNAQIRILLTAALTDAHFEFRKQQYLDSFAAFNSYGFGPNELYIVEALKKSGPTFLNDYSNHVFYSHANNPQLRNNGINEQITVLDAVKHFRFDKEDVVIKLTGRHKFATDYFLQLVRENPGYDAYVRRVCNGNIVTAAFAMKVDALIQMSESLNYQAMESMPVPLETEVGNYITKKVNQGELKVFFVDKLDMHAEVYGSSTAPGAAPETIIW